MLASDSSRTAQASWPPERSQLHQLGSGTPFWVPTILRSYACLLPFTLSFFATQQGSPHPPPLSGNCCIQHGVREPWRRCGEANNPRLKGLSFSLQWV